MDPFLCERMDLLFGLLQHLIVARFSEGSSCTPMDFTFNPWSERAREALSRDPKKTAQLLKSIFSEMPGVTVTPPKE